jgi:hypothetical protein
MQNNKLWCGCQLISLCSQKRPSLKLRPGLSVETHATYVPEPGATIPLAEMSPACDVVEARQGVNGDSPRQKHRLKKSGAALSSDKEGDTWSRLDCKFAPRSTKKSRAFMSSELNESLLPHTVHTLMSVPYSTDALTSSHKSRSYGKRGSVLEVSSPSAYSPTLCPWW